MPPKAILLLDNCSAHSPIEELRSDDGNIFCMLLSPNVTAAIQPMDQNPIKVTKLSYRNQLLASIVAQEGLSIHELLQKHDLRHAILLLKLAWDECTQSVLQKAWHKLLNWDNHQYDDEDDIPLSVLFPPDPFYNRIFEETQQLLTRLAPDCTLSAEEINAWNADSLDENETDTGTGQDEDNVSEAPEFVPYNDAICAVNTLIKWNEYNTNFSNKHISQLLELRSDIVKSHSERRLHQNKVTDYFTVTNTI